MGTVEEAEAFDARMLDGLLDKCDAWATTLEIGDEDRLHTAQAIRSDVAVMRQQIINHCYAVTRRQQWKSMVKKA